MITNAENLNFDTRKMEKKVCETGGKTALKNLFENAERNLMAVERKLN